MTWYREGLRFACTQCGKCCTGGPGYVWVDEEEIGKMADFLQVSKQEFLEKYTREVDGKRTLVELPNSYDCIFLREKKCLLYEARPKQCKTFPFWPENLTSRRAWNAAARRCEGIDHPDAPLISLAQIQKTLDN